LAPQTARQQPKKHRNRRLRPLADLGSRRTNLRTVERSCLRSRARVGEDIRRAFGKVLKRLTQFAPIAGAGRDVVAHGIDVGTIFRAGEDWSQNIADRRSQGRHSTN
jgi:hypothetical protein